jgi:hypothetical protein
MVLLVAAPDTTDKALADEERVKLGTGTSRVTGADAVKAPEVPVMVAVYVPGATLLADLKVTRLEALVLGDEKAAVTPAGSPEMESDTALEKLPAAATEIVLIVVALAGSVRLAGDADKVKLSAVKSFAETSRSIAVLVERLPELPLTVIAYFPDATEEPAVSVSVLLVLVLAGLKAALMPDGRPEAERATLPVNPWDDTTSIVLVAFPPAGSDTLSADATRFIEVDWVSRTTAPQPVTSTAIEVRKITLRNLNQL